MRVRANWVVCAVGLSILLCLWARWSLPANAQRAAGPSPAGLALTQVLGRPTDHSITLSVLGPNDVQAFVEYGAIAGQYSDKTPASQAKAGVPLEIEIGKLKANTRYYYRLRYRQPAKADYQAAPEYSFQTQRTPGSTFVFDVQSDSHPERLGRMYDPELYARTLRTVRQDHPDFYISMGDDFGVDALRDLISPEKVAELYINQRPFLGMDSVSAPLFLVNGNHEQAAKYLLDGTPNNNGVWSGRARVLYYPLPAPDGFYTGDEEPVQFVGLLRDYYAWTWGDALFVTIDPYWHSSVVVDNPLGKGPGTEGPRTRDMWDITLGEAQYKWLKKTLEQSKVKYKFIFTHHVLGTGRGGADMADLYEWGGKNKDGVWEFDKKRPGWELPIHQVMVKNGVTIFFQGHDHLFDHQERDGVVYQETPNPGNPNYDFSGPNGGFARAYHGGDYRPNSGYLRVTVSPENVKVDYVRSYLPKDETAEHKQGEVAFSYTVASGKK